ncbi:MAG: hypothetical protein CSB06_02710 [Bacteroidia bacterium]|nr:MAG: hypothetical protein CSB06_02710 [Bacteroidia bacterium]
MTPEEQSSYTEKIQNALAEIRPYLLNDEGDVEFVELQDDMTVVVQFKGTCISCPMSAQTLKFGVENSIKNAIPEIKKVITLEIL